MTLLWSDGLQLTQALLLILGALLPLVNPLGAVPIFLTLTRGCDDDTRRDLARHIALYAFLLLLGAMLLGSFVLRMFDLSVPVVQVAGGAVVCALGWRLLSHDTQAGEPPPDPQLARRDAVARAFYPLTMPVSIDAGVIAVAITLGANHGRTLEREVIQLFAALLGAGAVAAALWLAYRYAGRLSVWLGNKGMEILLRLSALIVLCIGVQIVWNGARSLLAEVGVSQKPRSQAAATTSTARRTPPPPIAMPLASNAASTPARQPRIMATFMSPMWPMRNARPASGPRPPEIET